MRAFLLFLCCLLPASTLGQQQGPDVRTQIAAIGLRNAISIDDYLSKCTKVIALLPELDAFYKQSAAKIADLRAKNATNRDFLVFADFYTAMNKKDEEGLVLIRQEMNLAVQLSRLNISKRQEFFDKNILPVHRQEDVLAEQEIQFVVDGRNKGVPLPDDILRSIANRK